MKSEGHLVDGFASSAQHNITILPSAGLFSLCGFQGAITREGQMPGSTHWSQANLWESQALKAASASEVEKNVNAQFIS